MIIQLPAHERMSPVEVLAFCSHEEWKDLIVFGFQPDNSDVVVRSSHMSREFALWLTEHLKLHIMERL